MRVSGRPLLDTRADAALFVDPHQLVTKLDDAVRDGLNVLVSGARGCGKTSLLRQLLLHRRTSGAGAAFASAGAAGSARDVLALVLRALGGEPSQPPGHESARSSAAVDDVLEALRGHDSHAGSVVLLDNVAPAVAHGVFGQLRDELWQLPLAWVVTCADSDEPTFLRPPADAFFDTVVRLPPLDEPALRDLLRRRASASELDDAALASIIELAHGNPRAALDLTRQLSVSGVTPEGLRADIARRQEALARLGRPAQMLLAELDASGGASASDEALLSRLGWTRARAAQVLDQLASAGLVQASDVRNGPGRPRRVYRPAAFGAR